MEQPSVEFSSLEGVPSYVYISTKRRDTQLELETTVCMTINEFEHWLLAMLQEVRGRMGKPQWGKPSVELMQEFSVDSLISVIQKMRENGKTPQKIWMSIDTYERFKFVFNEANGYPESANILALFGVPIEIKNECPIGMVYLL